MPSNSPIVPKVTRAEYEALATLRYALRRFQHFSEQAAQKAGLTPQQHQALLAIKGFPGTQAITVGELAERLQVRHHSAVGLVDRLAADGLVKRAHNRADRRQVQLALTKQAESVLEHLSAQHREELRRAGPEIETLLRRFRESL